MSHVRRLRPEVRALSRGAFLLERDVHRMEAVHAAGAPEAVILYGARILEATVAEALECVGLDGKTSSYAMLTTLEDLGLLHEFDWYVGHALRRLGNEIRHVGYAPEEEDADIVLGLVDGWLTWFFVGFPLGARLPSLTEDGGAWLPAARSGAGRLLRDLARFVRGDATLDSGAMEALARPGANVRPGHRALLGLAGEALIGRGEHATAQQLLEGGLRDAPEDVRLLQLLGLARSRRGDLAEAVEILAPLYRRNPADEESAGILAGVYKRLAHSSGEDAWMRKAHRIYRQGWKTSKGKNPYLGLNAAATALLSGDEEHARSVGREVSNLLRERDSCLRRGAGAEVVLPYYTRVTVAEAHLLAGEIDAAIESYRHAFHDYPARVDDIAVTMAQADAILRARGREDSLSSLLAGDRGD